MNVAILIDKNKRVLPLGSPGNIELYSDSKGFWECIKTMPFELNHAVTIKDIQAGIRQLVDWLEDCNVIVIDGVKGMARGIIGEFRIGIWQFSGSLQPALFDQIRLKLESIEQSKTKNDTEPVLIGSAEQACYEIDLSAVLERNAGMNSRDVLIPFLQNTDFRELTVFCNHLPKWFKQILEVLDLDWEIEDLSENKVKATVRPLDPENGFELRKQIKLAGGGCGGGCSSSSF